MSEGNFYLPHFTHIAAQCFASILTCSHLKLIHWKVY